MEIKLTLNKNSFDNLERLKSLLSHKNPSMSYGELFKILSELALDKYDPIREQKRQNKKSSLPLFQMHTSKLKGSVMEKEIKEKSGLFKHEEYNFSPNSKVFQISLAKKIGDSRIE